MKNKLLMLIGVVSMAFLLQGCDPERVKPELITPPDSLMSTVKVEEPPMVEEYVNLSCTDKEDMLIEKFRKQTLQLEACNNTLLKLQSWKKETIQLHESK